jgi:hypothetical protein
MTDQDRRPIELGEQIGDDLCISGGADNVVGRRRSPETG